MPKSLITADWGSPSCDMFDTIASIDAAARRQPKPFILVSPSRKREIDAAGGIDAWVEQRLSGGRANA